MTRREIEEQIEELVPDLEHGDTWEAAFTKIRDVIVARNEALEFIRSNLSKMHVDDNIKQRCLDKIKEVLG